MPPYGYTRSPYGLAPAFSPGAVRWSGQKSRFAPSCQLVRRSARGQRQYATLGLTATPGEKAGVSAASTGAAIGGSALLTSIGIGSAAGPIGAAIGAAIGLVASLITGHHAAAEATEAQTLGSATPGFIATVQLIFQNLNSGAMTPTAAISALQSAQTNYYSSVSSIIKKGGACATTCMVNGVNALVFPQNPAAMGAGLKTSPNCCNASSTCNAACCIGCTIIEPSVNGLIAMIRAGGGTWTIAPTTANGEIAGTPAVTLTYDGSQGTGGVTGTAQSILGGTTLGLPTWAVLAAVGLLLFVLMK